MRVALFITCLNDTFYPRVGRAMVRVLRHFGCRVVFPAAQTCCGQPACNSGFRKDARAQARHWMRCFRPYELIVTPSGSCMGMVKEQYPRLLQDDPQHLAEARRLGACTYEFQSFLRDVLHLGPDRFANRPNGTLTYLYPCHLRQQMDPDRAVDFVAQWAGPDYVPCPRLDQCCGFGGLFALHHPSVSEAIARDKLRCLLDTGARTVVCNEGGCRLHLEGLAHRTSRQLRFRHLAELLAESLDLREALP